MAKDEFDPGEFKAQHRQQWAKWAWIIATIISVAVAVYLSWH